MHEKWSAGIWCTMTVFVFGTSRRRISTAQTQNACTTVINNIPIKHWVVPSSWSMAKSTNRWSTLRTPGLNYSSTTLQQQTLFKHLPYTYSHDKNMSARCRWNVSWIKCQSVQDDIKLWESQDVWHLEIQQWGQHSKGKPKSRYYLLKQFNYCLIYSWEIF